jgi:hypothetical protein
MQFKRTFIALSFASLLVIGGCASVPMGDSQRDATLKTFNAPQDKAAVYAYRNESIGAAVKMDVSLDGKPIDKTAAKTYLYEVSSPPRNESLAEQVNSSKEKCNDKQGKVGAVHTRVQIGGGATGQGRAKHGGGGGDTGAGRTDAV